MEISNYYWTKKIKKFWTAKFKRLKMFNTTAIKIIIFLERLSVKELLAQEDWIMVIIIKT